MRPDFLTLPVSSSDDQLRPAAAGSRLHVSTRLTHGPTLGLTLTPRPGVSGGLKVCRGATPWSHGGPSWVHPLTASGVLLVR